MEYLPGLLVNTWGSVNAWGSMKEAFKKKENIFLLFVLQRLGWRNMIPFSRFMFILKFWMLQVRINVFVEQLPTTSSVVL